MRDDLSQLAREAVDIAKELYNVGQADRPNQLAIEIESERAEIDFLRAQNEWMRSWQTLAAMIRNPNLPAARLAGSPEEDLANLNETQMLETLVRLSPDIRVAQVGVERARAVLARARAERIPISSSAEDLVTTTNASNQWCLRWLDSVKDWKDVWRLG